MSRLAILVLTLAGTLAGQRDDPVQWSLEAPARMAQGARGWAQLKATIREGWHLYSTTTPPGPIPTRIEWGEGTPIRALRLLQPPPQRKFDPNFNADSETYDREAVFWIEIEVAAGASAGPVEATAQARYQVCSDTTCLRPVRKTATATVRIDPGAAPTAAAPPAGHVAGRLGGGAAPAAPAASPEPAPVSGEDQGFFQLVLVAFGFGLAAVFTPCVFPMIPITMSFFLNRPGGGRADSILQAVTFCLGIVALFTSLGLIATAALGPFGVVQLGSNAWVNLFIALVFFTFGLSLLGAFEITLPSGLLTKLDQASQRGGLVGTLVMGLTFSLTAFACVGPFVGTLLAASVQSGGWRPAVGMAAFAAGLAAPFFLLALFPQYLRRLPKSGGWLPRVKVVMGFVILAAMVKYLSNIDAVMQWGILTRDRFLALWIVLLAMPGLYLLGLLRMEGIEANQKVGVARALVGAAFLVMSVSLVPGLNCGRLGELDAYVPACPEDARGAGAGAAAGLEWLKNDYEGALARARVENKLVFVNFTGYACTNCHWMKANMFPRPEITAALKDFVLVELYTDGTDAASEANQKLQEGRFQTVAIPHYAILDADQRVLGSFVGLTKDAGRFLRFIDGARAARGAPGA